jgi:hypothetical protein
MGRSSEWSVSKDRYLGWHVTEFRIQYIKAAPAGEEAYWAAQAGLSDPKAALVNHLRVNPSGPEARLFAWNHSGGLRPLSREDFTKYIFPAATAAGLPSFKGYSLCFGGTFEQPTTRHSLRCHQIHGEMVRRIIYRQHAVILAPYMQATPVLGPLTRFTIPPVRQFSTIISPPPITWASNFDVCVAAVLLIGYTAHPAT